MSPPPRRPLMKDVRSLGVGGHFLNERSTHHARTARASTNPPSTIHSTIAFSSIDDSNRKMPAPGPWAPLGGSSFPALVRAVAKELPSVRVVVGPAHRGAGGFQLGGLCQQLR